MGIISLFNTEIRWGKHMVLNAESAIDKTKPEDVDPKVLDTVYKEISEAVMPVSGAGRQTIPDNKSLVQIIGDLLLIKPGFDVEWIDGLTQLAMFHPDISAAVDNISLANTELQTYFDDSVPDSLQKEMLQVLLEKRKGWYAYADGIDGFIDDTLTQCAITGAQSHEWIVSKKLDGIASVVLVDPKNILFHYDTTQSAHVPVQKIPSSSLYVGPTVLGQYKKLNTVTYRYAAMRRMGDSPYAVPPFLSSLENVVIQKSMVKNIGKIIEKLGVLGFLKVMLNIPQRTQTETAKEYYNRVKEAQEAQGDSIKKGLASSALVGIKGFQEIEMQTTNQNVTGAETLMEMNDRLVVNGLKQPLEMMNRKNTTSETFGRVMLAKLGQNLRKYQKLTAGSLSYGDLLHLRMMGYPVKTVINEFEPVMLGDKVKEEEAFGKRIENATKLYNAGIINQTKRANMCGEAEADQEEPRVQEIPGATTSDPGGGADVSKKTAASNTKHSTLLPERFIKLLEDSEETGMGYHVVDLYTNSGKIENVIVTNCEYTWTQQPVVQIQNVVLKKKHELVDFFVESLSKNKPVYWGYNDGHNHEGCSHTEEELGVPKKEEKFWNRYNKDIKSAWNKTTLDIQEAIIENLSQIELGVTPQAIEGNVLYSVYSKVDSVFIPLIKPIVQKHVKEIYQYYRKSKAIWEGVATGKKDIPDAVFNLTDIRAMEFFKDSDVFYLGKFVTDPDARKRMTKFIKENYIDKNTEIGTNKDAISKFAKEFRTDLLDQDWKMRRIIDTTVNKVRNTASIMYMEQAEVSEYRVVGITDRLQCEYCKSMNDKVLSVKREVLKIERVISSPPEEMPNISPFITALKVTPEQVRQMSGEALQDMGVGSPSYHGHCRCMTVVNIV